MRSSVEKGLLFGLVVALQIACSGAYQPEEGSPDDIGGQGGGVPTECSDPATCTEVPDGHPIAVDVDGVCMFTPGVYIAFYEVLNSTCGSSGAFEPRMVVVEQDGKLTFTPAGLTPEGCVDSEPIGTGCSVAFDRTCSGVTAFGLTEFIITFTFQYATGTGQVSFAHTNYVGDTVDYSCVSNMSLSLTDG